MLRFIFSKNNFNTHNISHFLETKVFLLFIIFFCLAFQAFSQLNVWTETELYAVHSSQYLFSQYANEFLFALKPLFYSILKLSFTLSSLLDWLPMTGARFLFALNGLAILALFYFYIKNKTNRYNAILAVLFLASLNIFLDRAFRVRSDLLSTSCSLICLLVNLNIKEKKDDWKFYLIAVLLATILLISPKGVYWLIFTSILLWHDMKRRPNTWFTVKTAFLIYSSFYLLSFIFKDPFFIKTFYQSAKFYLLNLSQSYQLIEQYGRVKALYELSHIGIFISRNPLLVLILFLKFLFIIASVFFSKTRKINSSDLYFLILTLIMIFHPQQKLFFLSAISPFFCIAFFTDQNWRLIKHSYSAHFKALFLTGWFIYAFSHVSYFNYKIYTKKNNRQQKNAIKELNDFYKSADSSIRIFDPNCIIYSRKTHCKYILFNQKFQDNFNFYIHSFDIILSSALVSDFKLLAYKKSQFEFVNIKNHIYYKAFIIDSPDKPYFDSEKKDTQQLSTQIFSKNQLESLSQKQKGLSGKKILEDFEKPAQTKTSKQLRKYFYLYIDQLNRPVNPIKSCSNKTSLFLKEGCYYSENQLAESFIPLTNKRIALFYIPFPFHLKSEKSLRILLRYDKFN